MYVRMCIYIYDEYIFVGLILMLLHGKTHINPQKNQ